MRLLFKKIYLFIILNLLLWPGAIFAQNSALETLKNVATQGSYAAADEKTVYIVVADIIGAFLGLLGAIFVILIVWAGYTWMTAGGDEQKLTKAKDTIYRAIIGLIITAAAYAITAFVFKYALVQGSGGGAMSG